MNSSTIENNLLNHFDQLNDASDIKLSYQYDNIAKKAIGWRTWTLDGYYNGSHLVHVWESETDNGTKYIKFLNQLYENNLKTTNNLISTVRNHPDGFIKESLEDNLSDSQKKHYFLEYCKMAYLYIEGQKFHFTEQNLIDMKNMSNEIKELFCLRVGITLSYLNNKLNLF